MCVCVCVCVGVTGSGGACSRAASFGPLNGAVRYCAAHKLADDVALSVARCMRCMRRATYGDAQSGEKRLVNSVYLLYWYKGRNTNA